MNKTEIIFNKPDTAVFVNVDRVRLYEVISNLLNNAINSTKNNGKIIISLHIVKCAKIDIIQYDNDNNNNNKVCIVINIKDNGTGIDSEIEPRLFTKFASTSESGLGLGLYISKSIVEAHGGTIRAQNNADGKGAQHLHLVYQ